MADADEKRAPYSDDTSMSAASEEEEDEDKINAVFV